MNKKKKNSLYRPRRKVNLEDINELVEMGLKEGEISKETGISEEYIRKMLNDYYKDY